MGIKNEENGTWTASFRRRHPTSKKPVSLVRKGIATKAEANRVLKDLERLFQEKVTTPSKVTWKQVCMEFMVHFEGEVQKSTAYIYWKCLKAHTIERWGSRSIEEVTTQEIRLLVKHEMTDKAESYRKSILKYVRAVMTFAVDKGYLNRNPTPQMKFRTSDKLKGGLTEDQAKRFLNLAREMKAVWYPHWAMALLTGMRSGELYALRWENVNLDDRLIYVKEAWNNKDGIKCTKSGHDRVLEIAPPLVPILRELKIANGCGDDGFVLPRLRQWDKGDQARELRMFLEGMGIKPIRFHDLRASWATMLLSKGVAPIVVMKMGGWRDMKTMQVYVRQAGVDIRGASDVLDFHDPSAKTGVVVPLLFTGNHER